MNSLSDDILLYFFTFLDLKTLLTLSLTRKEFKDLISSPEVWKFRKPTKTSSAPLQSGAIYHYRPENWSSSLHTAEELTLNYPTYQSLVHRIHEARSILRPSLDSKMNMSLSGMLKYEYELFWNSKQKESQEGEDSFICELIGTCSVFTIHFKAYRAVTQGGVMYPPKFIRVCIGNEIDNFHYISDLIKVPMSEKLMTFQVLPQIVIGKYLKVELIGMPNSMPGGAFIVALDFFDVIGNSMEDLSLGNLEKSIFEGNTEVFTDILSRNKHKATPFIVDLLLRKGLLSEYLQSLSRVMNEVESFMYVKNLLDTGKFPHNSSFLNVCKPSEALGDLLFEAGAFSSAYSVYIKNMDIWKLCKTAIVLKHIPILKSVLSKREPRYPNYSDLLKIASSLGKEFEEFLSNELI